MNKGEAYNPEKTIPTVKTPTHVAPVWEFWCRRGLVHFTKQMESQGKDILSITTGSVPKQKQDR